MNKSYLKAETPAWILDGFMFGEVSVGGGRKGTNEVWKMYLPYLLIHMLKLKCIQGPLGFLLKNPFIIACSGTRSASTE